MSARPGTFADTHAIDNVVVRPLGAAADFAIHSTRSIVDPQQSRTEQAPTGPR